MTTTISRDRIQFEDSADRINDGNEQAHRDACAREWAAAATTGLEAHGGGKATVRLGNDHHRFEIDGDREIAAAADEAGWQAVDAYVAEQIAQLAKNSVDLRWIESCDQCGHEEPSDGYGGNDCPECGYRMRVLVVEIPKQSTRSNP